MIRVASFVTVLVLGVTAAAAAPSGPPPIPDDWVFPQGSRIAVPVTDSGAIEGPSEISHIIYVNRCPGGCTFTKSTTSDAQTNETIIGRVPNGAVMTLSPWSQSEAVWDAYITCMREVYGPYDVQIVTEDPGPGVPHHEAVAAGRASEMMITGALGIAPLDSSTCIPKNNVISFTFANDHGPDPINLCWTTAQESAHSFGLDHAFDCSDPLTYLDGCGQKFFRNRDFRCGEFAARDCVCGSATQNSHNKLLATFGPGTDPAPPVVTLVSPMPGPVQPGFSVFFSATDHRGVFRGELYINGWKWAEDNMPRSTYVLNLPGNVPDGVMDIEARACNDLNICGAAPVVRVTRGAPCDDAAADCLLGQRCDAGRCLWDPPSVELGGDCTFDQECLSLKCADGGGGPICTESCFGPPNDRCPEGFECSAPSGAEGVCRLAGDEGGGCCDAGSGGGAVAFNLGLGAMIGLLIARRRRKS